MIFQNSRLPLSIRSGREEVPLLLGPAVASSNVGFLFLQ